MLDFKILKDTTKLYKTLLKFNYDRNYSYLTFNENWTEINKPNKFRNKEIDKFLKKLKIKVNFGRAECAYYEQEDDKIIMPYKRHFRKVKKVTKEQNYYYTLLHEVTHWSGSEKRLNRKCLLNLGEDDNLDILEELIAELGSNYLVNYFNITEGMSEASVIYIKNYLETLPKKLQKSYLIKANKEAEKAAKYLINKYETK